MREADLEFERGNFSAACDCYRRVIAVDPANIAALRKFGVALKNTGRLHEAAGILKRCLDLDSADVYSRHLLGEIAEAQDDAETARANWQTVIGMAPDFEPAYHGLCRLLHRDGKLDLASQVAADGIRHIPRSADLYFCLGNLHLGLQQFDLAEQAYRQAIAIEPGRADIFANLGLGFAAQNRLAPAIEAMEHAVDIDPHRADVHNNLADTLFKADRLDQALACLSRAAASNPAYAAAAVEWGNTLLKLNRPSEAAACFEQFLKDTPENIPTLFSLASARHAAQQWDSAAQAYGRILDLLPEDADVLCNLGINSSAAGDHESAAAYYRRALSRRPEHTGANHNLAALLQSQGKLDDAVAHYLKAVSVQPDLIALRFNLANAYRTLEKWTEAAGECGHILRIDPDHVGALFCYGVILQAQGLHEEAISRYRSVLAIEPAHHDALINLGTAFEETGQLAAALECCERALQADASSIAAHINMAAILTLQGRLTESIASCDRALEIDPHHPDAHYSRGLSLLRLGRYDEGWKEYEYRWARSDAPPKPEFPGKEWRGEEDLHGKTILLYSEQGLGDTIQFIRYLDQVAAKGATIVLELQAPLFPLLKNLKDIACFVVRGDTAPLPAYDFQCSLLSLPAALKSGAADIPAQCPYLQAPPDRMAYWKQRLGNSDAPKIGLSWAGNPLHKNDRNRSMALSNLAPLWAQEKWKFLSLQKEVRPADAATLKEATTITDLSSYLSDLAETAAIISCLDLLVTVDSSLAHLAGALNVPVWIMLPHLSDFRWMMQRQDSPWYPSARLFRQDSPGNWPSVVDAVGQALHESFGNRNPDKGPDKHA